VIRNKRVMPALLQGSCMLMKYRAKYLSSMGMSAGTRITQLVLGVSV
jgi:hypothetical protein